MRLSTYFMPIIKENPSEAKTISHTLMLRSGMIRQTSSGIYSWLPLGLRVLRKIEQIVREEQDKIGAHEMLMPTIQTADIWRESGRYDDYGPEMLRIIDRQGRELLYGPTNEEMITKIAAQEIHRYRDLPKMLYHIQWKFRDEIRPRFGVMRGREFLMKDAYSFDLDYEGARHSYNKMFVAYLRTFARMGLHAIPMAAESGPIGGDLSHEFVVLTDSGESEVFCHEDYLKMECLPIKGKKKYEDEVKRWTKLYAATDEKHDPSKAKKLGSKLVQARGTEVGHIFYFGTKYSKSMGADVINSNGQKVPLEMGSYGIGISRLVGAIIEANHDDSGIVWPEAVSPFEIGIINLKPKDEACTELADNLYYELRQGKQEILYDDRDERAGTKFASMDLIGLPLCVIIGPKDLENGEIEIKYRNTGEKRKVKIEEMWDVIENGY